MKQVFPILIFVFLLGPVSSFSRELSGNISLGLGLNAENAEQVHSHAFRIGTRIVPAANLHLLETLDANLRTEAVLLSGSSQARYTNDFPTEQKLKLKEASLFWAPIPSLKFKAGAMDQNFLDSPALLSSVSFPAITEEAKIVFLDSFYLRIFAEQAIATTPDSTFFLGSSTPPFFFYESVGIGNEQENFLFEAGLGHYSFRDLPSSVAHESQFLGSSVTGLTKQNSQFEAEMLGFEWYAQTEWKASERNRPFLKGRAQNKGLKSEPNREGAQLTVGTKWAITDTFKTIPQVTYFVVDSDVSPAYYNSKTWGHSNREGLALSLGFQLPQSAIQGQLEYANSHPIFKNTYQDNFEYIGFSFGVQYDIL